MAYYGGYYDSLARQEAERQNMMRQTMPTPQMAGNPHDRPYEALHIHVANGMSISVGRHVGDSGQVVQNAHIIRLNGQWQLYIQDGQKMYRTFVDGMIMEKGHTTLESGSLITFGPANRPLEMGPDIESGWIKIGEGNLKMVMPTPPGPAAHLLRQTTESSWNSQVISNSYPYYPQGNQVNSTSPISPVVQTPMSSQHSPVQSLPQSSPNADELLATEQDVEAHMKEARSLKRTFQCAHCSKIFSTSGHLARHVRLHTGEKPYACSFEDCEARFSRQDNMMAHYKTHFKKANMTKEQVQQAMEELTRKVDKKKVGKRKKKDDDSFSEDSD